MARPRSPTSGSRAIRAAAEMGGAGSRTERGPGAEAVPGRGAGADGAWPGTVGGTVRWDESHDLH